MVLLTKAEYAVLTGQTLDAVYMQIREGKLPSVKMHGLRLIPVELPNASIRPLQHL
jgi:hypothetical protein